MCAIHLEEFRKKLSEVLGRILPEFISGIKPISGGATENGFYFDFDTVEGDGAISEKIFPSLEEKLKLSAGEFGGLAFKLKMVSGAYEDGDENKRQFSRVSGIAFEDEDELEKFEKQKEEMIARDHRRLGKELDLFVFSDVVGKGLPLWTEKGAVIRRELEKFVIEEETKRGYKHVCTPDIASLELYKKSGHYPYYKDSMYSPIDIEGSEYMLRPMTCPHHFELYLSKPRSYREFPLRIAELAKLYRYEQSGELSGLVRARSFCLADAHIFCTDDEQAGSEVERALDLIEYSCSVFGIEPGKDYWYRLSLGNRQNDKKYYKDDQAWDSAEQILREVLKNRHMKFIEAEDEAAFYGPKIDIQMRNAMGKEDTAFTVQYDFVMPKRFNLKYISSDGQEKECVVIHRSSIGAIERITAFLIEFYAGAFPLWLSPVQIKILPVSEKQNIFANELKDKMISEGIRAECDDSNDMLQKKVRNVKTEKIPCYLVVGDKEISSGKLFLEDRNGTKTELSQNELFSELAQRIKERRR